MYCCASAQGVATQERELCRFVCQAEDGIRGLVRSRGLGDVYKRQGRAFGQQLEFLSDRFNVVTGADVLAAQESGQSLPCLLYTSDAADERSSVDLGGRRIIKKKYNNEDM